MNTSHISLSALPSLCQKFSQLVEILGSSDKNNFAVFLDITVAVSYSARAETMGATEIAGQENAGLENDGQKCRGGKCRTGN